MTHSTGLKFPRAFVLKIQKDILEASHRQDMEKWLKTLFTIVNLKGYARRKYISMWFSRPFEFRVVCNRLESLFGIVAYVSKHQSLDIFEVKNIEFEQIFQKQIWRNDLRRLNWQHVIFTLFSFSSKKTLTTKCKESNGQTEKC